MYRPSFNYESSHSYLNLTNENWAEFYGETLNIFAPVFLSFLGVRASQHLQSHSVEYAQESAGPLFAVITGTADDNVLMGTADADTIDGLGGNDILLGGLGADTLTGGTGADQFAAAENFDPLDVSQYFLDNRDQLNGDTITDFTSEDVVTFKDGFNLQGSYVFTADGNGGGSLDIGGGNALLFDNIATGSEFVTIRDIMGQTEIRLTDQNGMVVNVDRDYYNFQAEVSLADVTIDAGITIGDDLSGGLFGANYRGGALILSGGEDYTITNNGTVRGIEIQGHTTVINNNAALGGPNEIVSVNARPVDAAGGMGSSLIINNTVSGTMTGALGVRLDVIFENGESTRLENATINNDGLIESNFDGIQGSVSDTLTINNAGTFRTTEVGGLERSSIGIAGSGAMVTNLNNSGVIEVLSAEGGIVGSEAVAIVAGAFLPEAGVAPEYNITNTGRISSTGHGIVFRGITEFDGPLTVNITNTATGIIEADTNANGDGNAIQGLQLNVNLPDGSEGTEFEELSRINLTNAGAITGDIYTLTIDDFAVSGSIFTSFDQVLGINVSKLRLSGAPDITQDIDPVTGQPVNDVDGNPVFSPGSVISTTLGELFYTVSPNRVVTVVDSNGDPIILLPDEDDIESGAFNDTIVNSGFITGDIYVGIGDDTVTNTATGQISGTVVQGAVGMESTGTVYGGLGNDTLSGGDNDDRLDGGAGDDILSGGGGNDVLTGDAGLDTVVLSGASLSEYNITEVGGVITIEHVGGTAGDGTDTLTGIEFVQIGGVISPLLLSSTLVLTPLADTYNGTSGDDLIDGLDSNDRMAGNGGDDVLYGNGGNDNISGGADNDTLFGGAGNDVLIGGRGDDILYGGDGIDNQAGGPGNDLMYGGIGDDILRGQGGNDILYGGADDDVLTGSGGQDILHGDAGADILHGGSSNDELHGGADNDTLNGNGGSDVLYGGTGDDVLNGGGSNDILYGGAGADTLIGGTGVDELYGGDGNDTLSGNGASDTIAGGAGDDIIKGGGGNDVISGDAGNDTIDGNGGGDTINGGAGDDVINGGSNNDILFGGADNDTLIGSGGKDRLDGGDGNDDLNGGGGNDVLIGGAGDDILTGGSTSDVFIFGQDLALILSQISRTTVMLLISQATANCSNCLTCWQSQPKLVQMLSSLSMPIIL